MASGRQANLIIICATGVSSSRVEQMKSPLNLPLQREGDFLSPFAKGGRGFWTNVNCEFQFSKVKLNSTFPELRRVKVDFGKDIEYLFQIISTLRALNFYGRTKRLA
jgi:hypothetical protein